MARTSTPSDEPLRDFCREILKQEALLRQGGGKAGLERQRKLGRLPARERIDQLLDKDARFFEIGLWAAYKMYEEWGNIVAAGTVAGIGNVSGVPCMSRARNTDPWSSYGLGRNHTGKDQTNRRDGVGQYVYLSSVRIHRRRQAGRL